jgi:zinc protease
MKDIAILLIVVLLVFPVQATAGSEVFEKVLNNGLKVLVIEDHKSTVATFQVWYRVGSRNESLGKTGLSHFLEHMMFKGTERFGPKTFSQAIERAGGMDNAFTTNDYTAYFEKVAPDRLSMAITLEADRMQGLLLPPKDVLSERDVVMEERRMRYEDDPQSVVFEEVAAAAFKNYPYRWPVIGWMEDIKSYTREDLLYYYKTYYVPNNAFIVVAGDVETEKIVRAIDNAFGQIPQGSNPPEQTIQEPPQYGQRRVYVKKEAKLPYVLTAYKVPSVPDEESYALDVLSTIMSYGKSSRLYNSLVHEKQLALAAGADYDGLNIGPSLFYVYGTPAPGKSAKVLENAIYEEVKRLQKTPPSQQEMQKAINQTEAGLIMGQDSIFYQAQLTAVFEIVSGWQLKDDYLKRIRAVTPEQVSAVAAKYLVPENSTVGILIPIDNISKKPTS